MQIPFSRVPLGGNELKYVKEVLESGWLTTSSKAAQLEEEVAGKVGASYACAVNSCTSALHLALEALGISTGDKVLVPSLTFTATAEVIRYLGADPVMMDVHYPSSLVTPEILQSALDRNPGVKAMILVHYGGQAAQMSTPDGRGILDICRKQGVFLIEDAAHAFPARFKGQMVGSFGDVTCFSFYANKTMTTGEGGMLVTNNEEIYKRAKVMRLHGINRDSWNRYITNGVAWEYDVIAPGFKYNMPDINAAIGLAQLEKLEFFRRKRQQCAAFYYEKLAGSRFLELLDRPEFLEDHSWHLFPVMIKDNAPYSRNELIPLLAEKGIGTSVHYKPLYRMSYYRDTYNLEPAEFPGAEKVWGSTLSLPIYPDLTKEEISYVVSTLLESLKAPVQ